MVAAHLDKYGGRAKVASDHADELVGLRSMSRPEDVHRVCRIYVRAAERLTMILKKLGMPTLRWKMVQALRIVAPMLERLEAREKLAQEAREARRAAEAAKLAAAASPTRRKKKKKASSTKQSDEQKVESENPAEEKGADGEEKELDPAEALERVAPGRKFQLPPGPLLCAKPNKWPLAMSVASILRDAMQWVYRFDRAAVLVQGAFRRFVLKRDGRAHRRHVHYLLSAVQARWRGALGRREGLALRWQFESQWEQLFDEERHTYYFYNNQTRTSQWNTPFTPFRPFGWWPEPEPEPHAARGHCSRCFLEKSTRRCYICVDKTTSEPLEYCFACFAIAHRENAEMATHGFTVLTEGSAERLLCVQCGSTARRKCMDCDDPYCKACYKRLHRRGNRATHKSYGFEEGAPVCVECENDIALKYCKQCGDQFCLSCWLNVHRRGKKKFHEAEVLHSLTDGLDTLTAFVAEHRAKQKALAEEHEKLRQAGQLPPEHDKSPPEQAPPMSPSRLGGGSTGGGKKSGPAPPSGAPPKRNTRKERALAAASAGRSNVPIRRNRPKNWRQLRPPPRKPKPGDAAAKNGKK